AGGAGNLAAALLTGTHLRVTDPAVSNELANLSRFEIGNLKRQADYGDADASFLLAMAYEMGVGTPQSCTKAFRWAMVSAETGNAAAQFNLGLRYQDGDGVPVNPAEGLRW